MGSAFCASYAEMMQNVRMHIILRSIPLAAILFVISAAVAAADVRYASPSGSAAAPCADKANPCSLTTALTGTAAGDEVELAPGDYYTASQVIIGNAIHVHGEAGKPRPAIRSTSAGTAVLVNNVGATLSYVEVTYTGVNLVVGNAGTISRSRFIGTNTVSINGACGLGGDYDNSICVSMGGSAFYTNSTGAGTGVAKSVRNSTGVSFGADPGDCGLAITHSGSYARTYSMINTALEAPGNGVCLDAAETSAITLNLVNSNYRSLSSVGPPAAVRTINDTNSLQVLPGFVNQPTHEFHLTPASPLINAGLIDPANGALDFDGNPRTVGSSTDIGAFEYVPPVVAPPLTATTISKKLKSKSKSFTAAKSGAAFQAASKQPKKMRGKPTIGTLVSFTLSQADDVTFTLERAYTGRKSGSKCVKTTRANKAKKKCTYFKTVKGTEKATALSAGANTIWWTGRWKNKKLASGSYSLRGTPIKASTGNEPGTLDPRPVKILPK